jgi:hypothetical protein
MTEEEKAAKIAEAVDSHKETIDKRKKQEIKDGFLNPFGEETSYDEFLKEVDKSKGSIAEYCKGKITEDQLKWLEKDIEVYKSKKQK